MSIITKPATIEKDVVAEFSLNKSELSSLTVVANNAYYGDSSNWSKVILNYKSDTNKQFHRVTFDATLSSPTGNFLASDLSDDIYEINSIDIVDFDNGIFRVPASELTLSEFQINMGGTSPLNYINYNLLFGAITTDANGAVTCPGEGDPGNVAKSTLTNYSSTDYTFTFEIAPILTYGFFCGVSDSNVNGTGSYSFGIASYGDSNTVCAYQFNSPSTENITLLPSGNVVKVEKIGTNRYFYVNNVLIHSIIGIQPIWEYPTVRPMAGTPVTASSMVIPATLSRVFSAPSSILPIEEIRNSTMEGYMGNQPSSFSFSSGNLNFVLGGNFSYCDYYYKDIPAGFAVGQTYKLRVFIANHTGGAKLSVALSGTGGPIFTASELSAAIGSYVEATIVAGSATSSYVIALEPITQGSEASGTLNISKVELIPN